MTLAQENKTFSSMLDQLRFQIYHDRLTSGNKEELTVEEFLVTYIVGAKNIPADKIDAVASIIGDMLQALFEDKDAGFVKFSEMFDPVNDVPCWMWVSMLGHLPFFTNSAPPIVVQHKVTIPKPIEYRAGMPNHSLEWDEFEFDKIDPDVYRRAAYDFCQKHRIFT